MFPGESISVDHYTNVAGAPVGSLEAIQLRAGSSTFGVGDSVRLSSDLLYQYLGPSDAAVVSWVVEVLSGSGTFTLSEGIGNTATSLGSHTVAGPTTLVVPSTAISASNVYNDTDARLLLTCTSGSVVVQQVKLRVWPPEGVAGGWSNVYPSWEAVSALTGRAVHRSFVASVTGGGSAATAWADAFTAAQAHANEPWDVGPETNTGALNYQTLNTASVAPSPGVSTFGGDVVSDLWAVAVNRPTDNPKIDPSLGLVDGVDYIVPPTEVAWDTEYSIDAAGTVDRAWANAVVTVSGANTGSATGLEAGAPTLSVSEYTDAAAPFVDLPIPAWPDTTAATLLPGENALSLPDADQVLFAASFTWLTSTPPYPGGTNVRVDADWFWALGSGDPASPDFARLGVRYTYPSYRVWSPTAVTVPRLRQRNRDDIRARLRASRQRSIRARGYL